jgi:hypothetical protein
VALLNICTPLKHFFLVVLGFELFTLGRQVPFHLSKSNQSFLALSIFKIRLENYLPGLASNHLPPDLCLPSSWDYRRGPLKPGSRKGIFIDVPDKIGGSGTPEVVFNELRSWVTCSSLP